MRIASYRFEYLNAESDKINKGNSENCEQKSRGGSFVGIFAYRRYDLSLIGLGDAIECFGTTFVFDVGDSQVQAILADG